MTIFRRSRTAIGIDVGTRNIKAAQLCRSDGQYRIAALALLPRAPRSCLRQEDAGAEQIDPQEIISLRGLQRIGMPYKILWLSEAWTVNTYWAAMKSPLCITGTSTSESSSIELRSRALMCIPG